MDYETLKGYTREEVNVLMESINEINKAQEDAYNKALARTKGG